MGYYQIRTYLRLKPTSRPSPFIHNDNSKSCVRIDVKHAFGGPPKHHQNQLIFHFDGVIQSTSQEALFEQCALEVINDVLDGYNGTILAYGQSNSGKTFSMTGDLEKFTHRGIIPRTIHQFFVEKESKPEARIAIRLSYLEVYNEVIYDLLAGKQGPDNMVTAMEESGHMRLKGLSQISCTTEAKALEVFSKGERHRAIAATALNKFSNRSHSILTIYFERHATNGYPEKMVGRLNLVDLAGFQRFKGMRTHHQVEKEMMHINKSLTFLEQVVAELRKGKVHISFRQSQLTLLLREALGGNSKTIFIICALLENDFLNETVTITRMVHV
eukprot:c17042_g2_i1 orf=3-986(-)